MPGADDCHVRRLLATRAVQPLQPPPSREPEAPPRSPPAVDAETDFAFLSGSRLRTSLSVRKEPTGAKRRLHTPALGTWRTPPNLSSSFGAGAKSSSASTSGLHGPPGYASRQHRARASRAVERHLGRRHSVAIVLFARCAVKLPGPSRILTAEGGGEHIVLIKSFDVSRAMRLYQCAPTSSAPRR